MTITNRLVLTGAAMLATIAGFAGPVKKGGKPNPTTNKYIDKANMDLSVKPGDNFYLYANGNWIKNNPIPASKTRWGSFDVLHEESLQRLRNLLDEAAANTKKDRTTQMIGDFYASGMDSAAIEKKGIQPIKANLDRIAGLQDTKGIIDEISRLRTTGLGNPLFSLFISQDRKNVDRYITMISQGGITL